MLKQKTRKPTCEARGAKCERCRGLTLVEVLAAVVVVALVASLLLVRRASAIDEAGEANREVLLVQAITEKIGQARLDALTRKEERFGESGKLEGVEGTFEYFVEPEEYEIPSTQPIPKKYIVRKLTFRVSLAIDPEPFVIEEYIDSGTQQ